MPSVEFEPTISVRGDEDFSCLVPRGHCDQETVHEYVTEISKRFRQYRKKGIQI
jgi:hypothetical protein